MSMPPAPAKQLLTLQEVAESCGVTTRTVRRYVQDGLLPAVRDAYNRLIFDRAEVEAWQQRRRSQLADGRRTLDNSSTDEDR